jgi:hypothetical protein
MKSEEASHTVNTRLFDSSRVVMLKPGIRTVFLKKDVTSAVSNSTYSLGYGRISGYSTRRNSTKELIKYLETITDRPRGLIGVMVTL